MSQQYSTFEKVKNGLVESGKRHFRNLRTDVVRPLIRFFDPVFLNMRRKFAFSIILLWIFIAIVAPYLPVPEPFNLVESADGGYARLEGPSLNHPLGTTSASYSVLGQVVHGFRNSVFIGLGVALCSLLIGTNVGLISAYFGGKVDEVLMAITDLAYGTPFYAFAILVISLMGRVNMFIIIFVISIITWRSIARVIRSEALSIMQNEYITASRTLGTSNRKIIFSHMIPNILPLVTIYMAFAAIWGVIIEASLSFVGFGDPNNISWGMMLRQVYAQGYMTRAWWWVLAPAFALWLFIWALFVTARALEENTEIDASKRMGADASDGDN